MGSRGKLPANKLPIATSSVEPSMPSQSKESKDRERRWRAEEALRDIERAEGHKSNKDLMKDVSQLASEKVKNLKKICKDD